MQANTHPTRNYQNVLLVSFAALLVGLAAAITQYKASTILIAIAPQFDFSESAASWVMSIFTLIGIVVALPSGRMAHVLGFKKTIVLSFCVMILGSIIGLLSSNNGIIFIISRGIEGAAFTTVVLCGPIAIKECVPPEKMGLANGIWGCWNGGGAIIALLVTPQIFEVCGFPGVWLAATLFTVFAALFFIFAIKSPGKQVSISESFEQIAKASAVKRGSYKEFLRKDIVLFLITFACMNLIMLALLGLLPSILQIPEKGFSMSLAGFATTLASIFGLIASPLFGALADKIGRVKPLLMLSLIVQGPCVFVMYTQTGIAFWAATGVLGLIGFGCAGLIVAAWMQLIPRPELVAKGMALFMLLQCIGQFFGTFLVQLMLGPNFENYFFAGIVLMIIGLIGTFSFSIVEVK